MIASKPPFYFVKGITIFRNFQYRVAGIRL